MLGSGGCAWGRTSKMAASARIRPGCAGEAVATPPSHMSSSTHAAPLICELYRSRTGRAQGDPRSVE